MMDVQNNNVSFGYKSVLKKIAIKKELHCAYTGKKFTNEFRASVEHIQPHSEHNKDTWQNYIMTGVKINNKRGNMPLPEWLTKKPKIIQHIQNYLNELRTLKFDSTDKFKSGIEIAEKQEMHKLGIKKYVQKIVQTLNTEAQGVATFHGRQHNSLNTNA